jgi:hypothetical protein
MQAALSIGMTIVQAAKSPLFSCVSCISWCVTPVFVPVPALHQPVTRMSANCGRSVLRLTWLSGSTSRNRQAANCTKRSFALIFGDQMPSSSRELAHSGQFDLRQNSPQLDALRKLGTNL